MEKKKKKFWSLINRVHLQVKKREPTVGGPVLGLRKNLVLVRPSGDLEYFTGKPPIRGNLVTGQVLGTQSIRRGSRNTRHLVQVNKQIF